MEFGVRLQDGKQDFTPALTQAGRAEALGFDAVYLSEHTGLEPYWPSPLIGLSAVAAQTATIKLGTHVGLLPMYDPVRLAGDIACLDVLSHGRTSLGFGVGWRKEEFEAHGVPFEERGARMDEYLAVLRQLLDGEPTTFDGQFVTLENFELVPKPVQRPRPPLYVGGWSSPALRRAVELADGWTSPGGTIDRNLEFVERYRSRADGRITLGTEGIVVRADKRTALDDAERFLIHRKAPHIREQNELRVSREFIDHLSSQGIEFAAESDEDVFELAERYVEFETGGDLERYCEDSMFFAGTPDDCIEWIDRIADEADPDELAFRIHVDGFGRENAERTLELLGTEVLPSYP